MKSNQIITTIVVEHAAPLSAASGSPQNSIGLYTGIRQTAQSAPYAGGSVAPNFPVPSPVRFLGYNSQLLFYQY